WNFMQEGRAPQCTGISQRLSTLGGVENQLDFAVLDRVDNVGAPLQLFVDSCGMDTVRTQIPLRSGRGDDLEAKLSQQFDRYQNALLVSVAHRHEYGAGSR